MHYFRAFKALLQRNLKVIQSDLKAQFINAAVVIATQIFLFGYLLPDMGANVGLIGLTFLGVIVISLVRITYTRTLLLVNDLKFLHHTTFLQILPVPISVVVAASVAAHMIEMCMYVTTFFIVGKIALGAAFDLTGACWMLVVIASLAGSAFLGLLSQGMAYYFSYEWFMDNIWTRFLVPMLFFGCIWFPWAQVWEKFPTIAPYLAVDPMLHVVEFLRASVYFTGWKMIIFHGSVLMALIITLCIGLRIFIKRRLDAV